MMKESKDKLLKRLKHKGYTILELLIAVLITSIIVAATFRFYIAMNHQSEVQIDVSEIQHLCRASLFDIRKTLHMAGNRLAKHPPYEINGDSLAVYFSKTQPVDTVIYFLQEYTDADYAKVANLLSSQKLYRLMKKSNSGDADVFADFITDLNFVPIDPTTLAVTITAQASRQDDNLTINNGFRTFSLGERVNLRYLQLIT